MRPGVAIGLATTPAGGEVHERGSNSPPSHLPAPLLTSRVVDPPLATFTSARSAANVRVFDPPLAQLLFIESSCMAGSGELILTGQVRHLAISPQDHDLLTPSLT